MDSSATLLVSFIKVTQTKNRDALINGEPPIITQLCRFFGGPEWPLNNVSLAVVSNNVLADCSKRCQSH